MLQNTGLLSVTQILSLNTMTPIYKIKEKPIPENLSKNTKYITDGHNYQLDPEKTLMYQWYLLIIVKMIFS